jgi:4-aminobutyrate aminotransferase/(S)-3-amino-2-methylpropionate transaminase
MLATAKNGVIAFEGAYHGLGYGALTATHREFFRSPFQRQLADFVEFVPFPETDETLERLECDIDRRCRRGSVGAILVEPVQGRGGIRVPPLTFLPMLRRACDTHSALLIVDEVFTGFGRTGRWFACEHSETVPDLICLGKALTGGFPLSACVGKSEVMDAWPPSTGEALHTSTFLGHPVGCAMALANIDEIRARNLPARSARLGERLLKQLSELAAPPNLNLSARGMGLMAGLEVRGADGQPATERVFQIVKAMLREAFISLPEGAHGNVISFTPPLTISERELTRAVAALADLLKAHKS